VIFGVSITSNHSNILVAADSASNLLLLLLLLLLLVLVLIGLMWILLLLHYPLASTIVAMDHDAIDHDPDGGQLCTQVLCDGSVDSDR
jgi:hypothetical protein